MSVIIDTTMSEVESVMKYARYGANNCMIGNGWEIKELVRCKDCKHRPTLDEDGEPDFPDWRCPCQCDDYYYSLMPKDDWFCGNADRREE